MILRKQIIQRYKKLLPLRIIETTHTTNDPEKAEQV
jgi:hypothetical protein